MSLEAGTAVSTASLRPWVTDPRGVVGTRWASGTNSRDSGHLAPVTGLASLAPRLLMASGQRRTSA
jgi:hypothetical protein